MERNISYNSNNISEMQGAAETLAKDLKKAQEDLAQTQATLKKAVTPDSVYDQTVLYAEFKKMDGGMRIFNAIFDKSMRCRHIRIEKRYLYVGELASGRLEYLENFGKKSRDRVILFLEKMGVEYGSTPEGWKPPESE